MDEWLKPSGMPVFDRYDPRMIQELVLLDDAEAVTLARWGLPPDEMERSALLRAQCDELAGELKRSGQTAKIKARLACETLIGEAFRRAKASVTLGDVLDALRVLGKLGDLEPRNDAAKVTGTIVRVDLNFAGLGFAPAAAAMQMRAAHLPDAEDVIEGAMPVALTDLPVEPLE